MNGTKNYEKRANSNQHIIFQEWNKKVVDKSNPQNPKMEKTVFEVIPPDDNKGFDKVTLQIQHTDIAGKTVANQFYFDIEDMLTLAHTIMRCDIQQLIHNEKNKILANGGFSEQIKLERGGKKYDNGSVLARAFYFQPATKSNFSDVIITIETGTGYETKDGLFNINYKAPDFRRLSIAMSYSRFMNFGVSCYTRLNAFMIGREIRGYYIPKNNSDRQENFYEQANSTSTNPIDMPPAPEGYTDYIGDMK